MLGNELLGKYEAKVVGAKLDEGAGAQGDDATMYLLAGQLRVEQLFVTMLVEGLDRVHLLR